MLLLKNMMYCCVLALAALALPVPATAESNHWSDVTLPASRQIDISAPRTGNCYRIFVSVPSAPPPAEGYPVLYVLDGNAAFPVAAFLARSAASRRKVTGLQPPLVVGIGYQGDADFDVKARQRDYTIGQPQAGAAPTEGGADRFLDFIEQELKPMIAASYPVNNRRQALFGHSFGGLLVLHALFTRPGSYSTFLASSPSIWWHDKLVLAELPKLTNNARHDLPRVQISVGALEDQPRKGNYPPQMLAMLAKRPMVTEARALAAHLQQMPDWHHRVAYYELEGEDHGPAWLPAMTRGMQFFLEQP
ncbi:MAG: hypothetical protein H6R04_503 [Burkholderiaceae bacterium]|nr:hypothetical protein [Burkholderiaceae bacterium]